MPYNRTYKPRTYRRQPTRFRRKSQYKPKKIAVKTVKRIAKSVHYQQTETKYKGYTGSDTLVPAQGLGPTFNPSTHFKCFELEKGAGNSKRIGKAISSRGLAVQMQITNLYEFPVWCRVLVLKEKNPMLTQTAVQSSLWLQDIDERQPIIPSGLASDDLQFSYNTKAFSKVAEKRYYLDPNYAAATGINDRYSQYKRFFIRHTSNLTYNDEIDALPADLTTPLKGVYHIVWMVTRPTGTPAPTSANFNIEYSVKHYYKDM